jgi:renalase
MKPRIAIIGAGITGLTLAQDLQNHAHVEVFEKSYRVGGRMNTRHVGAFQFDHGAQCFTARSQAFQEFIKPHIANGLIAPWQGKVVNLGEQAQPTPRLWAETHYVAVPTMNSLCLEMAKNLNIHLNCEVLPLIERTPQGYTLYSTQNTFLGLFDYVVATAPPMQTRALFEQFLSSPNKLEKIKMQSCFALMIGLNQPWRKPWIAAKPHNHPIKWISVNTTKPQRNKAQIALVAHSRNAYTAHNFERPLEDVKHELVALLGALIETDLSQAEVIEVQRWKFAIVSTSQKAGYYFDPALKLAALSDWCVTSRIEEVWANSKVFARHLQETLN